MHHSVDVHDSEAMMHACVMNANSGWQGYSLSCEARTEQAETVPHDEARAMNGWYGSYDNGVASQREYVHVPAVQLDGVDNEELERKNLQPSKKRAQHTSKRPRPKSGLTRSTTVRQNTMLDGNLRSGSCLEDTELARQ